MCGSCPPRESKCEKERQFSLKASSESVFVWLWMKEMGRNSLMLFVYSCVIRVLAFIIIIIIIISGFACHKVCNLVE